MGGAVRFVPASAVPGFGRELNLPIDPLYMLLPFRIALLAAVAIGSLVLLGGLAESALHGPSGGHQARGLVYGTTPSDAASTLAKLRAPYGFRQTGCKEPEHSYIACFETPRSLVLEAAAVGQEIAAMGAKLQTGSREPVSCSFAKHSPRTRPLVQFCTAGAVLGAEHLLIFIKSAVLSGHHSVVTDTRGTGSIPGGTEVRVGVIGHPLRPG